MVMPRLTITCMLRAARLPAVEGLSRRGVLRTLAAAGIGLVAGGGAHGYLYERHRVGVTRAMLPVSGLPTALDGLRVALLTDFHLTDDASAGDIQRAIDLARAETPDLIVLGGDYITQQDRRFMGRCADLLQTLTAPFGVFGVLGNHDDDVEMSRELRRRGIEMLNDARTTLTVRGEILDLVGLRFWTRQTSDLARLVRGGTTTTVLLAHDPRRIVQAAALNVPLMLSGHTHGGQIVIPGLGTPAARKFPVIAGTARRENTTVFVSRGIGTVYIPCRINCPPEVALLTLRRLAAAQPVRPT
jgi:predicted MPP superfamily phosphohydrolase